MSDNVANSTLSHRATALMNVLDSLPGRSYALLDAACSHGLLRWMDSCPCLVQSLYSGTSAVTLREQAPYLVELDTTNMLHARAIATLFDHGWGQNLMLLLKSNERFDNLRINLKKKLVVRNEQGLRLYFRFYDPRVARSFLAANAHESLEFYFQGDILAYIIESLDAQAVVISRSSGILTHGYKSQAYRIPATVPVDDDMAIPPENMHVHQPMVDSKQRVTS
jgi:Domain of unknown function (DUF4123)